MANEINNKLRGRPAVLTREQILAVAAEMPLKGFSIRGVAERLSVSPQSIYYYFENKTSLLGAMASTSFAALPDIEAPDWRSYLRQSLLGFRAWTMASETPARLPEVNSGFARFSDEVSEGLLVRMEGFVAVFVKAGFSPQEAVEVWNLGATLVVRSVMNRQEDGTVSAEWDQLRGDVDALGSERFPSLSAALSEEPPPVDAMFERIVEVAIEGVAAVYGID